MQLILVRAEYSLPSSYAVSFYLCYHIWVYSKGYISQGRTFYTSTRILHHCHPREPVGNKSVKGTER